MHPHLTMARHEAGGREDRPELKREILRGLQHGPLDQDQIATDVSSVAFLVSPELQALKRQRLVRDQADDDRELWELTDYGRGLARESSRRESGPITLGVGPRDKRSFLAVALWRRREGSRAGRLALAMGAIGVLLAVAGCGSDNAPGSYVGRASNAAVFVQWTRSGSQLTGTLHEALVAQSSGSGGQSIGQQTIPFTGTVQGSSVTLSLSGGLQGVSNLTGTLSDARLKLDFPGQDGGITEVQMQPATGTDYNRAVSTLQGQVDQANAGAQQAQQQQAAAQQVSHDAQAVQGDLGDLGSASGQASQDGSGLYSADLATEQKDVGQAQQDAQQVLGEVGSTDSGTLCSDAGTVQSDIGTVESDLGQVHSDQGTASTATQSIADALTKLRRDFAALQVDRQNSPAEVPTDAATAGQVQAAISSAQQASRSVAQAASAASAQAQALLGEARGDQQKSDAACKHAGG